MTKQLKQQMLSLQSSANLPETRPQRRSLYGKNIFLLEVKPYRFFTWKGLSKSFQAEFRKVISPLQALRSSILTSSIAYYFGKLSLSFSGSLRSWCTFKKRKL